MMPLLLLLLAFAPPLLAQDPGPGPGQQLDQRLTELQKRLDYLEKLDLDKRFTEERAALLAKIDALEARLKLIEKPTVPDPIPVPEPASKKLFDPSKLKFVGGWKTNCNGYSHNITLREIDGKLQILIGYAVPQGAGTQILDLTSALSTDPDLSKWNLVGPKTVDSFRSGQGLYWDAAGKRLLSSDDGGYITNNFNRNLFSSSDGGSWNLRGTTAASFPQARTYGGGFCDIPPPYSTKLGGSLGIGQGGYESGQGSTAGPTFAVAKMPSLTDASIECVPLLQFGDFGTKDKSLRERRPPDYSASLWNMPLPDGDVGYWQCDRVYSMVWVDAEKTHGLVYLTLQGCGPLDYARQSETFGETQKRRLYVYDPEDLVRVKESKLKPHELRGKCYDFPDQNARAIAWHKGRLFVLCTMNDKVEQRPAIKVYEMGE
jgi:hypothetical protein